jgi:hypothetical protein
MPYEGTYPEVLLAVCSTDPPPKLATGPAGLGAIVLQAMAKERPDRFGWMKDFAKAIRAALPNAREHTELFGPRPSASGAPETASRVAEGARRKLPRAPYVTPVRILMGDLTIDGRTEDISTGGLLVVCHQVCPTDTRATLRFALPIEGTVASVDVQVRWHKAARQDDPRGLRALGVEFLDVPADVKASIARYVSLMGETAP